MKKQDYATLAGLVKHAINVYKNLPSGAPRIDILTRLMHDFAKSAHVDKAAFLKACGLE